MEIFVIIILLYKAVICQDDGDKYPDVKELFPAPPVSARRFQERAPIDFNIDIERINVSKLRHQLENYMLDVTESPLITTSAPNALNPSLRRFISSVFTSVKDYFTGGRRFRRYDLKTRAKVVDMMLQTIYMARHKMKLIETDDSFNQTDTSYRMAFLYQRLRRIWRKMMEIFTIMTKRKTVNYYYYDQGWMKSTYTGLAPTWYRDSYGFSRSGTTTTKYFMIFHFRIIKLHAEFLYYWWVIAAIDGKYSGGDTRAYKSWKKRP